jgi:hypothetical protein
MTSERNIMMTRQKCVSDNVKRSQKNRNKCKFRRLTLAEDNCVQNFSSKMVNSKKPIELINLFAVIRAQKSTLDDIKFLEKNYQQSILPVLQ